MSKKPNPYAWMTAMVIEQFKREQEAAQKPCLTLITGNERTCPMSTPNDEAPAPIATPLHKHGAFDDMGAAINLLALGADALKGIGAMMQPSTYAGDEDLHQTRRSDMAAIFQFFGEVLREPALTAREATERLEGAAAGRNV